MEKRVLGKDLEVSEIGLGCMGMSHAYGTVSTEKEAEELIAKAIDEGCTFFDTAEIYGTTEDPHHNEKLLGEVLRPYVELVSTTVDNWDSYDTVYIGYPIWWGIAVWPVDNFVKDNDFTGKTVIPFCTAASSGIGDSGNLLKDMAGTGDWKDGERFYGGASEADISSWIDSLGV